LSGDQLHKFEAEGLQQQGEYFIIKEAVNTRVLGTSATIWPIVPAPDDG
jgi:hypothetical protein